jgi:carbon monoxide dehydrogenase subunit G
MGEARAEITIDRPVDDVWAVVGNFGDLSWMPGIERCELAGEGDDRVLTMFGMRVVEHLRGRDDEACVISYGITEGDLKFETHVATITVTPEGDGSHVTWDVEIDDSATEMMGKSYQKGLDSLKATLEG